MSKARITYRFDKDTQHKQAEEENIERERIHSSASGKVIPLYQEDTELMNRDYGAWRSPFDVETARIERMIKDSEKTGSKAEPIERDKLHDTPSYYTSPRAEESFQRVAFYEELPVRTTYRQKGRNTNWFSLTTAVTGAVLTGIVLGMFVLSLFRGEANPLPEVSKEPINGGLPAVIHESESAAPGTNTDKNKTGGVVNNSASLLAVTLPEQTYFFIQNGVFSTSEGAKLAVQLLKDKGLSGAMDYTDKFTVYAGAALDRDDALFMSNYLQNESVEVFTKPYVLPAVQQISWAGDQGHQLQGYMEKSRNLVQMILDMTANGLHDINDTPLSASDTQLIQQEHKLWTEYANQLEGDASEGIKSLIQKMNKSLNSAMFTIEQYNKNPAEVYLWQAQAAVSEHIIYQKQFLGKNTSS
jgi:stage II sporulation protein B